MKNKKKEQSIHEILNDYVERIDQTDPDSPEMQIRVKEFVDFVVDSIKSEHDKKLKVITHAAKEFQEAFVPFKLALNTIKEICKDNQKEGDLSRVSDSEIEQAVRDVYYYDSDLPF